MGGGVVARCRVQHFVACRRVEVIRATRDAPYTLHEVNYRYVVPEDAEWPAKLPSLWLFARFMNGTGKRHFTLGVIWLDGPQANETAVAYYDLPVQFPADAAVVARGWNVSGVRYPGPGRYAFRLSDDRRDRLLAAEYIEVARE